MKQMNCTNNPGESMQGKDEFHDIMRERGENRVTKPPER